MLKFLKYIVQLILSPGDGWEELSRENPDVEELTRSGLYPLMGVAAATEILALLWNRHSSFGDVLVRAICVFGAFFVSIFIGRLIFDFYLKRVTKEEPDQSRGNTVICCGLGLMVLIRIIENCLPWHLALLKFLPLYVVLVLYKSSGYMDVRRSDDMAYLAISASAVVVVPLAIYYLLYIIGPA